MSELIPINPDRQTTSARALWEFLDKPYDKFTKWFNQYKDYGFIETEDYRALCIKIHTAQGNDVDAQDYEITVDMAKELAMLQKSEKGQQARRYFIEVDKKFKQQQLKPMSELEMVHKISGAMLEQKKRLDEVEAKTDYLEEKTDNIVARAEHLESTINAIKDTIIQRPEDWKREINAQITSIVDRIGGQQFQEIRHESYILLEQRAHVNLELRLMNRRARMLDRGMSKTEINKVNKLDIIAADPKLREIYSAIIQGYVIKFCT